MRMAPLAERTVHIVDDDDVVRASLESRLRSHGFATACSASADSFLRTFDPAKAACVLIDIHLPEVDGLTLLEKLRRDQEGVPIVILTEYGDIPSAVRAIRAGAADVLQKPCSQPELLETIKAAIQHARHM